jgi:ubiquinone/menaquinone biosynthesis C-methylase UbiE
MMRTFDSQEMELMDRPQPPSPELAETLRQLEFLNRHFGGHGYARRFLRRHFQAGGRYRVLDLATGGGDYPRAMVDWARATGVELQIDAVDANPGTVILAREFSAGYREIHFHEGDIRQFAGEPPYDLVHCSLSMHHFPAEDAVHLLARCRTLTRNQVLVTDLERSFLTRSAVRLANTVFRHNHITVQDGETSTRRAFSFGEFRSLAERAGWERFGHGRFLFCRQALWLAV